MTLFYFYFDVASGSLHSKNQATWCPFCSLDNLGMIVLGNSMPDNLLPLMTFKDAPGGIFAYLGQ